MMVLEPSETGEVGLTMPADALQAKSFADLCPVDQQVASTFKNDSTFVFLEVSLSGHSSLLPCGAPFCSFGVCPSAASFHFAPRIDRAISLLYQVGPSHMLCRLDVRAGLGSSCCPALLTSTLIVSSTSAPFSFRKCSFIKSLQCASHCA